MHCLPPLLPLEALCSSRCFRFRIPSEGLLPGCPTHRCARVGAFVSSPVYSWFLKMWVSLTVNNILTCQHTMAGRARYGTSVSAADVWFLESISDGAGFTQNLIATSAPLQRARGVESLPAGHTMESYGPDHSEGWHQVPTPDPGLVQSSALLYLWFYSRGKRQVGTFGQWWSTTHISGFSVKCPLVF